ncbi:TolC family protein [Chitinophaga arvensicola]|uniref:Outer membrane protein, cobalt-zinc-cadmium efflux system n=1 Tax=Chitinophaga arvensicola TaxID=29529 RepID=A0A1I0SDX0_9BACT|nr:TolC family protein [Chitinophaga arvensicola]SEW57284.1 outer membrane protein, cobalt-zinc-cadmium efflux system [Chitinophaga arvensicola]
MILRLALSTYLVLFAALFRMSASAQTSDTLRLSLPDAEQLLLQKSIPLLTQRYNIDSAKAGIITAKLWDNPQVTFENALYNHTTKKWFDFSYESQNTFQAEQLFKLAGKRNKAVKLAQSGVKMSEYQFYDLLRTLRFSLHDNFYDLYYKQRSLQTFASQIAFLQTVVTVFTAQKELGNIAPKEIVRIKSMLYDLQHDHLALQQDIQETQSDLALLIRVPAGTVIQPVLPEGMSDKPLAAQQNFQSLLDTARANRYDLKIAQETVNYNNLNLRLQKSMAVPDLQVGFAYDKQGNFERNYNGLNVSMPLPFFNRNQGNIKIAKVSLESSKLQLEGQEDQLAHEVMNSYQQALRTEQLVGEFDPGFENEYTTMMNEVEKNFRLHNIGLLEFIDLYDAYRNNVLKMNELKYDRLHALESLNFSTGTPIFHP